MGGMVPFLKTGADLLIIGGTVSCKLAKYNNWVIVVHSYYFLKLLRKLVIEFVLQIARTNVVIGNIVQEYSIELLERLPFLHG
jgi:hypothetical protein